MTSTRQCRECGAEIGPDAPEGMCPQCLMRTALAASAGAAEGQSGAAYATTAGFAPGIPTVAELSADFPQLEILETIGFGGMGAVYRARQVSLDRMVALKILSSRMKDDPMFSERFGREARALARLSHPNIVSIFDFGNANGRFYFIMEYVEGVSLRQLIRNGKLTPEEAFALVPPICDALQYAHDEGVVHRDIKPENILVDKRGRVKIADFGLSKIMNPGEGDFTLTGARDVMGTPQYMAPEQMRDPGKVDHRADIYALGVVFYEMLTGQLPMGRFPLPSERVKVDVRLDEVVLRTLESEPERRYQHASEVKTDLEQIGQSKSGTVPPQSSFTGMPAGGSRSSAPSLQAADSPSKANTNKFLKGCAGCLGIFALTFVFVLAGAVVLGVISGVIGPFLRERKAREQEHRGAAQASANLVRNGGFEESGKGPNDPAEWDDLTTGPGSVLATLDTTNPRAGGASLKLSRSEGALPPYHSRVAVRQRIAKARGPRQLSLDYDAMLRGVENGHAAVKIEFEMYDDILSDLGEEGERGSGQSAGPVVENIAGSSTSGWTRHATQVTVPASADGTPVTVILTLELTGTGEAWFDNVELKTYVPEQPGSTWLSSIPRFTEPEKPAAVPPRDLLRQEDYLPEDQIKAFNEVFGPAGAPGLAESSQISNGGFEDISTTGALTHWDVFTTPSAVALIDTDTEIYTEGLRSARVACETSGYASLKSTLIEVPKGVIAAVLRGDVATSTSKEETQATIDLSFLGFAMPPAEETTGTSYPRKRGSGKVLRELYSLGALGIRGTNDWKSVNRRIDIPTGSKYARLRLSVDGPGTAWFDDLSLEWVGGDPNATPVPTVPLRRVPIR